MTFADRLDNAIAERGTPVVVGIDPHLDLLPPDYAAAADPEVGRSERADLVARFCTELVEVAAGRVPAIKPQSAFFEQLGADGVRAWEEVLSAAKDAGLLVIGDVKRGDIASTAKAYARAHLAPDSGPASDAITINPYLGADAVAPFLKVARDVDAGLYVLVRTSNPGSGLFQSQGEPTLAERVAKAVHDWGAEIVGDCGLSSVGAVVGATHPGDIETYRKWMPRTPLLIPGFGAQGAKAADIRLGFVRSDDGRARGAIVPASRSVAFAHAKPENAGRPWKDAAIDALDRMIGEVGAAIGK